jgi:cytosine/adenosine deaminase-related metal-dependent hydrolase
MKVNMQCLCHWNLTCNAHEGRRRLLRGLIGAPIAAATAGLASTGCAQLPTATTARRRTLLKGGYVATLDRTTGDIAGGDVLIDGPTIVAIGRDLPAGDAEVIDASNMVVMPGFIDTHRHTWQTALRGYVSAGNYFQIVLTQMGPLFRPEDVYIGNLLGAVGALDSGVTTMLDWSHIMNSPAHADAAIQALKESGIRSVFAHGVAQVGRSAGATGQPNSQQHSADIRRLQSQYFNTDDQLMTLALAFGGVEFSSLEETVKDVRLAREMGIRATTHVGVIPNVQAITKMRDAGILGPDITYVHASRCTDAEIKMIADSGGGISSSALNERLPGLQQWLKYGLRPSLSLDTEVAAPADLFVQMRALYWHERNWVAASGERAQVKTRDLLEFATIEGARQTGLDRKVGTLAVGKRADIVMLKRNDVRLLPTTGDPLVRVVLMGEASHVQWVFVDGQVRKRAGQLVGVNLDRLNQLALASQQRLIREAALPPQS